MLKSYSGISIFNNELEKFCRYFIWSYCFSRFKIFNRILDSSLNIFRWMFSISGFDKYARSSLNSFRIYSVKLQKFLIWIGDHIYQNVRFSDLHLTSIFYHFLHTEINVLILIAFNIATSIKKPGFLFLAYFTSDISINGLINLHIFIFILTSLTPLGQVSAASSTIFSPYL